MLGEEEGGGGVCGDTQILVHDAAWKVCRKRVDEMLDGGEHRLFTVCCEDASCLSHTHTTVLGGERKEVPSMMHVHLSHRMTLKCGPALHVLRYTGRPVNIRDITDDDESDESDERSDESDEEAAAAEEIEDDDPWGGDTIFPVEMVRVDALAMGDYLVCYDNYLHHDEAIRGRKQHKFKVFAYHEYGSLYHHLVKVHMVDRVVVNNDDLVTLFSSEPPPAYRMTAVADCGVVFEIAAAQQQQLILR